eukprot:scaffold1659_cov371-Prasinococcus_capsulatus_cf.AAC.15
MDSAGNAATTVERYVTVTENFDNCLQSTQFLRKMIHAGDGIDDGSAPTVKLNGKAAYRFNEVQQCTIYQDPGAIAGDDDEDAILLSNAVRRFVQNAGDDAWPLNTQLAGEARPARPVPCRLLTKPVHIRQQKGQLRRERQLRQHSRCYTESPRVSKCHCVHLSGTGYCRS